jgi:hypothetical protein
MLVCTDTAGSYDGRVDDARLMIVICWEMSRNMLIYDFAVVLESMTVQYSAPGVCQTRVPHRMLSIIVASKYETLLILGRRHEILGTKWSAGRDV